MRLIGLDVGDRRIGVAVSDPSGLIATAHSVIERQSFARDAERVAALARAEAAEGFVLGLPRRLNGTLGDQAAKVERFARELRRHTDLPIDYWDERLSSVEANRALRDAGVRGQRRRGLIDAAAATLILQGYLDRQRADAARHAARDDVHPDCRPRSSG